MKNFLLLLTAILYIAAFSHLQAQSPADESDLQAFDRQFMIAYNQQDGAALRKMYTDDAVRIDQKGEEIKGADNIVANFVKQFRLNDATVLVRHIGINWSDFEHAWIAKGSYEVFGKTYVYDIPVNFSGSYANTMLKQDGQWKIAKSIHSPLEHTDPNLAVVDGLYKSFAKGDVQDVLSRMDANIVWNEAEGNALADGNPYIGPDAVLNGVFARIMGGHEYFNLKDIQLHEMSNNQVLATLRYDAKVKHNGELYNAQVAHLWTLNNEGKIIAFQQYVDTKKLADAEAAGSLPMIMTHNYYLPVTTSSPIAKADYYKAALLGSQVRIGEAKAMLDEAIKKDPNFFMAYALKVYYASDKERDALIDKALAIDTKGFNEAEKNLRQQLVIWDKDPKASVAEKLKSLVAAYPNTPQAYYWAAANAGFNDKNDDEAIKYTLQLIDLSPDFGAAYNILGYSYMRKKEMKKAKSAFESYLATSPSDANPYDSMADYFMANKEYDKAAEYYDKAVEKGMSGASERAAKAREMLSPTAQD